MGRMRSQLDDLIAQQGQSGPPVGVNAGIAPQPAAGYASSASAPQYPPSTQNQPYQPGQQPVPPSADYPPSYSEPPRNEMRQPSMTTQYGQVPATRQQTPDSEEVSRIKNSLERLSNQLNQMSQNQAMVAKSQSTAQASYGSGIDRELAALRREIANLSSATANNAVGKEVFGSIKLIAEGMRQLQETQNGQPEQFGQVSSSLQTIHSQLDQLNRMAPEGVVQVDMSPLRSDLESNFSALGQRLEMMTNDHNQIGELTQAIDGSHADIVSRLHALAEHSPDENISDIRLQLQNIGQTVAGLSEAGGNALESNLGSIDDRLDEITRGMVALAVNVNEGNDDEALERVEARVTTLAKTIDTFVAEEASRAAARKDDSPDDETRHQLHGLTNHIDILSEKIEKLTVAPAGSKIVPTATIDRNDDGIIKKLDELVSRMDDLQTGGASPESNPAGEKKQLAALEKQLGEIVSHMGSAGGGGEIDFSPLNERLDTIEQQVAVSRDIAIEVASKVACEAANNAAIQAASETVQKVNSGGGQIEQAAIDPALFAGIADEIRRLQDSSQSQDANNQQIFDTVRGSLDAIIERLGNIEGAVANVGENVQQASHNISDREEAVTPPASSFIEQEVAEQRNSVSEEPVSNVAVRHHKIQARAPLPIAESEVQMAEEVVVEARAMAPSGDSIGDTVESDYQEKLSSEAAKDQEIVPPSLDMEELPEVSSPNSAVDAPLEPGSGGPDLEALMRQANQRQNDEPDSTDEGAGTDFIAAARRAAQAAALEANAAEEEEKTKAKSKRVFSVKDLFARRKKVILLTAAAVLIAAIAVPMATAYLKGGGNSTLAGSKKPMEQSAIEPAPQMPDKIVVGSIEKQPVESVAKVVNSPELMQAPTSVELTNEKVLTRNFAVENNKVDTTAFSIEKPVNVVSKVGTAITNAPMPSSNVGNIQLRQAAASGKLSALFEIGRIYTDGNGVERDLSEAAKWYRLAAERGHGPSQYRLGNFYEKGHGMTRDIDQAMVWYRKAAKQGNALAMHNLAVVSAMGTERAKADMAIAAQWFIKAAELGIKDSQVNLGILYTKGLGLDKDLVQAYKWFGVASRAGDSDASDKRDTVAGLMTPSQLEHGRAEIELWKKTPINNDANFVAIPDEWKGNALAKGQQSKRQSIRDAQALLSKLGFDAGPADGMMGVKTRNAVMAFQQRAGMTVDGQISSGLISKLKGGAV